MSWFLRANSRSCCAAIGLFGLLSFLGPSQSPQEAVTKFARAFETHDAGEMLKLIHPDVVEGKDVTKEVVGNFLERYKGRPHRLQTYRMDKRLISEDRAT